MKLKYGKVKLHLLRLVTCMIKSRKQFCKWAIKFGSLPLLLKKELEKEMIVKAKQYCRREGFGQDEFVITMIKPEDIHFSFIVSLK